MQIFTTHGNVRPKIYALFTSSLQSLVELMMQVGELDGMTDVEDLPRAWHTHKLRPGPRILHVVTKNDSIIDIRDSIHCSI